MHEEPTAAEESPAISLIREVEGLLGMRAIVYFATGSMEQPDIRPLNRLLQQLGEQPRAALILQSPGGDADAAFMISNLLLGYIKELHVFIPTYAAQRRDAPSSVSG